MKRPYTTKLNKLGLDDRRGLSKSEEIEILETLNLAFRGTGNYLESLFTDELVLWASQQIKNDFFPCVYAAWMADQSKVENMKEREKKLFEERTRLEWKVKCLETENAKLIDELNKASIKIKIGERSENVLSRLTEAIVDAMDMAKKGEI